MIESTANPKIKRVRKLLTDRRFRKRENRLVIEGDRWLTEVTELDIILESWFATRLWIEQHPALTTQLAEKALPPLSVSEGVMKHLTATATPSGALAIAAPPTLPFPTEPTFILILDQLRDPGNLGTMIRAAAAAGADGLILGPNCVDLYNPKVVRSTMGTMYRIPIQQATWAEIPALVEGCQISIADMGGKPYDRISWREPTAIVIGGEAHGPSDAALAAAGQTVAIPMHNGVESLNAAVAGTVLLFEVARQRRTN